MQCQVFPGKEAVGRWENLLGTGRSVVWEDGRGLLLTILLSKIIVLIANIHGF